MVYNSINLKYDIRFIKTPPGILLAIKNALKHKSGFILNQAKKLSFRDYQKVNACK